MTLWPYLEARNQEYKVTLLFQTVEVENALLKRIRRKWDIPPSHNFKI